MDIINKSAQLGLNQHEVLEALSQTLDRLDEQTNVDVAALLFVQLEAAAHRKTDGYKQYVKDMFGPDPSQVVVCAAIRSVYGVLICGARHFDNVMREQIKLLGLPSTNWEQGFIDQKGQFLTREEAWKIAIYANQIVKRVGGDEGRLFSENLY